MEKHSRVYAEIDLDAIRYNMEQMKQRVGADAQFIAVVKTDGYGHGAIPIAQMLEKILPCGDMRLPHWKKRWICIMQGSKNQPLFWDVCFRISMRQ